MFSVISTISYFELGYLEFPAISNSSFFPYTLNQPRYFDLVKSRVQEKTPKRPTKSEVRQAIETLSRYSLFAVEEAEIQQQTSQLSFTINVTKVLEKNKFKTAEHSDIFFNATASADLSDI